MTLYQAFIGVLNFVVGGSMIIATIGIAVLIMGGFACSADDKKNGGWKILGMCLLTFVTAILLVFGWSHAGTVQNWFDRQIHPTSPPTLQAEQ